MLLLMIATMDVAPYYHSHNVHVDADAAVAVSSSYWPSTNGSSTACAATLSAPGGICCAGQTSNALSHAATTSSVDMPESTAFGLLARGPTKAWA